MIYLIDDNHNNQRINNYGISFVEEDVFNGYLVSIEKLEKRERASDISHLKFLQDAVCILMHTTTEDWDREKGFLSGSTTNVKKIKEEIADFGDTIPLVLFSNGMGEPVYSYKDNPNFIREIKKNYLYERLYDFVDHYKNTSEIELRILAWGKNFRSKEASSLAKILIETLAFKNETDKLNISDLSSDNQKEVFQSFVEMSLLKDSYSDILQSLVNTPISILEFRNKINLITESFSKYGKNIYPWKQ